jgi:L-lactate utilization protein LutB
VLPLRPRLKSFEEIFAYQGEGTCAADGMCQEKCPVKINTGELVKHIRAEQMSEWKRASDGAMVRCAAGAARQTDTDSLRASQNSGAMYNRVAKSFGIVSSHNTLPSTRY